MYAIQKPQPLPEPETVAISMGTYEKMFSKPAQFRDPFLQRVYIVSERVETVVDTIRIPVTHIERRDDLRLFYGDVTIEPDRVRIGSFNPGTSTWEALEFSVPVRPWSFYSDIWAGYPAQFEAGMTIAHRSGIFGRVRAGYLIAPDTPYLGVGVGYRF